MMSARAMLFATINFRDLLPALQGPLDALAQVEFIKHLNQTTWLFAIVETFHILSMVALGGAVVVLNLRLLGAVLGDVPAASVERATRPWLIGGTIGTVLTGLYMGLATIVTLLTNGAFFVKMIALVAAILLSLAVSLQVRSGADESARPPLLLAGAAIALWLAALLLFALTSVLSSGALLVALAGFALFAAFLSEYRRAYLGLLALVAALAASLSLTGSASAGPIAFVLALGGAVLTGALESRHGTAPFLAAPRLAAFSSSLAWVTVAAAGRWIGFI
nr:DUF6644 family protein [Novosphingobium sp.]